MAGGRWARIGDVFEIRTPRGLAYAQYINEHSAPPRYGSLIRILSGFYDERPETFDILVQQPHVFMVFFPLNVAIRQNVVQRVASAPVPRDLREFPVFRCGVTNQVTRRIHDWWLWDGKKEWRVGTLTPEQRSFPIRQIVNDTMLIIMIEHGTAANQGRGEMKDEFLP